MTETLLYASGCLKGVEISNVTAAGNGFRAIKIAEFCGIYVPFKGWILLSLVFIGVLFGLAALRILWMAAMYNENFQSEEEAD